jgi:branched-chain amino acid transport system substrate-binding protein
VDQTGIPVVGGDLFSTPWWSDPHFYPVGTYVDANAFGSTAAVAKTGHNKVAVLYCIEAAICPPYKDAVVNNASKGGYTVVYNSQVTITAPDYTSVCQNAKDKGATQISMIVDGSAVSRLARSCHSIGYDVPFAVASLGSTFPKDDQNVQRATVTVASAVAPWFSTIYPGQRIFQQAMHQFAPSFVLDPTTPEAWADGMMLKAAIDALGPSARTQPITTALIKKGLSMIHNETLGGLVAPTSFSTSGGPNPKNMCYFPATFGAGGVYRSLISGYQCLS